MARGGSPTGFFEGDGVAIASRAPGRAAGAARAGVAAGAAVGLGVLQVAFSLDHRSRRDLPERQTAGRVLQHAQDPVGGRRPTSFPSSNPQHSVWVFWGDPGHAPPNANHRFPGRRLPASRSIHRAQNLPTMPKNPTHEAGI